MCLICKSMFSILTERILLIVGIHWLSAGGLLSTASGSGRCSLQAIREPALRLLPCHPLIGPSDAQHTQTSLSHWKIALRREKSIPVSAPLGIDQLTLSLQFLLHVFSSHFFSPTDYNQLGSSLSKTSRDKEEEIEEKMAGANGR